jgi:hypothetical protein
LLLLLQQQLQYRVRHPWQQLQDKRAFQLLLLLLLRRRRPGLA